MGPGYQRSQQAVGPSSLRVVAILTILFFSLFPCAVQLESQALRMVMILAKAELHNRLSFVFLPCLCAASDPLLMQIQPSL